MQKITQPLATESPPEEAKDSQEPSTWFGDNSFIQSFLGHTGQLDDNPLDAADFDAADFSAVGDLFGWLLGGGDGVSTDDYDEQPSPLGQPDGQKAQATGQPAADPSPKHPDDEAPPDSSSLSASHSAEQTAIKAQKTHTMADLTTETSAGLTMSAQGTSFDFGQKQSTKGEDGEHASSLGGGLSLGADGLGGSVNRGSEHSWSDEDGEQHIDASGQSAAISSSGIQLSTSKSSTGPGDSNESSSFSAGLTTSGALTASGGTSFKGPGQDAPTTSINGGGSLDVFGDEQGVSLQGGVSRGKASFSLSGGWTVEVTPPAAIDQTDPTKGYVVGYSYQLEGGGALGYGVTFGASGSSAVSGQKTFADLETASRWYELPDLPSLPSTAQEVAALRPGDIICAQLDKSASVTGEQGLAGGLMQVTAGAELASSSAVTIERAAGNVVVLRLHSGESGTLTGGVGSGVVGGVSGSASRSVGYGSTWELDLDEPAAREAYSALVTDEVTPAAVPGVKRLSAEAELTNMSSVEFNLLGISGGEQSGLKETVSVIGDERTDTAMGWDTIWAGVPFFGSSKETASLEVSDDAEGREVFGKQTIADTERRRSHMELSDALDKEHDAALLESGASSGTWTVETDYNAKEVERYLNETRNGKDVNSVWDDEDQLRLELQETSDARGERVALARYVENAGEEGLAKLHDLANEQYVKLEGDPHLTGLKGKQDLDANMALLEEQQAAAATEGECQATYDSIHELLAQQEDKLRALSDRTRYAELPYSTRAKEMGETEEVLAKLAAMESQARAAWEAQLGESGLEHVQTIDGPIDDKVAECGQARSECEEAYEGLRRMEYAHRGMEGGYEPREELGGRTFGLFAWGEQLAYDEIDVKTEEAMNMYRKAQEAESEAQHTVVTTMRGQQNAAAKYRTAASLYRAAKARMEEIKELFLDVERRHNLDISDEDDDDSFRLGM